MDERRASLNRGKGGVKMIVCGTNGSTPSTLQQHGVEPREAGTQAQVDLLPHVHRRAVSTRRELNVKGETFLKAIFFYFNPRLYMFETRCLSRHESTEFEF